MTPERWRQVEEIFQAAVDLLPEERARYLSQACATDTDLKRNVEVLLSQHDSAGDLLEHSLYGQTDGSVFESFIEEKDPMLGRRLGSYRIEREIGRGGMGAVYEASRADNEFNKRAAIKLVKRGMDTDFILRRFRKERQILAALDHPHIAGLLDGGTTDDGLPYFVMEFIEGSRFTVIATTTIYRLLNGSNCFARSAMRSTTRTRNRSYTATSSRRTCS